MLGGGLLIASMVFIIEKVAATFGISVSTWKHCWTQLNIRKMYRNIILNVESNFVSVMDQIKALLVSHYYNDVLRSIKYKHTASIIAWIRFVSLIMQLDGVNCVCPLYFN